MEFSITTVVTLSAIFFCVSIIFAMFGRGGGSLYVPIMVASAIPFVHAAATSFFIILGTSIAALIIYRKAKLVDLVLAAIIDPPTDIMAFVGGYFSGLIKSYYLMSLFGLALIASGYFMIFPINKNSVSSSKRKWYYYHREFGDTSYDINVPLAVLITGAVGLLCGMTGITGGTFKIPLMVLLCGVPMKVAIGTSSLMVSITALFGWSGHVLAGHFSLVLGLPLAVSAFLGGRVGAKLSVKADPAFLKKAFGVLLWLTAAYMLFKAYGAFISKGIGGVSLG